MNPRALAAAAAALLIIPVIVLIIVLSAHETGDWAAQGGLATGTVPAQYEGWVIRAGTLCPEITAPLVAAQIDVKTHWNPNAAASDGAVGLAQLAPAVWSAVAVDADNRGTPDPRDAADAIMTLGTYDCQIAWRARADLQDGRVHGQLLDIVLAAVDSGYGAVLAAGDPAMAGDGPGGYVGQVEATMWRYTQLGGAPTGGGGPFGAAVLAAAERWIGITYSWGGGNADGPTFGIHDNGVADTFGDFDKVGFDCSGLVLYSIAQASGHRILLPRTVVSQLHDPRGIPVDPTQMQPGDIVVRADADHTAIYAGAKTIVEAPESGEIVKRAPLSDMGPGYLVRRFG